MSLCDNWFDLSVFSGIWWLLSLPASYIGKEITVRSQGDTSPSTKRSQGKNFKAVAIQTHFMIFWKKPNCVDYAEGVVTKKVHICGENQML